jgi:hypothetical protein
MGISVVMAPPTEPVIPGQRAACEVRIRNTGAVVDHVDLDVVGDASPWAEVQPAEANLLPGEESTAQIVFTPPRSAQVTSGPVPFALRALSREDEAGSAINEAVVEVAPYTDVIGEILPRNSTGSRRGRHQVALDNLGNHPELISLTAADPDLKLTFRIEPSSLTLEPGTATFVKLTAKPKKTFAHGANVTIPFQVVASPAEGEAVVLPGAILQTSMLPSWFFKALAVAAVAAVVLVALWFTVLQPTIESAARDVALEHTEELQADIAAADEKAETADQKAEAAASDAQTAGKQAKQADTRSTETEKTVQKVAENKGTTGTTLNPGEATDFRVTTDVPPEGDFVDQESPEIPADTTVWVTDVVLQNPAGDSGTLRIRRGDDVLLVFGLDNFRDLDYHFIQPAMFDADAPVVVAVDCRNEADNCTPSVYFSGQMIPDEPEG